MVVGSTQSDIVSQFGPDLDSSVDRSLTIFSINSGMRDLVGEAALADLAAALPLIEYNPSDPNTQGGNFLTFRSPGIKIPGYGTFDFRFYAGFAVDLALNLRYAYDFGDLGVTATVSAPRVDGTVVYGSYLLDTSTVNVTGFVGSVAADGPFVMELRLEGNTSDGQGGYLPGRLAGGLINGGVYEDGNLFYGVNLPGIDVGFDEALIGIGPYYPGEPVVEFTNSYLSGYVNVPELPSLAVGVSGTGAGAFQAGGSDAGEDPRFADLTLSPISLIPLVGEINKGNAGISNPIVDAGVDYTIFGLDISLGAAIGQRLEVSIKSVTVRAEAWEDTGEDADGGLGREALDLADGVDDNRVLVSSALGVLGQKLELGNFSQGQRSNTRIDEYYSITLSVKTDIDILLKGGVTFSALMFEAYVNPILLDERRWPIGPLFKQGFEFTIASIDIYSGTFDVVLSSPAKVSHTVTTLVDFTGTAGADGVDLGLVPPQVFFDGLGGDDTVIGNAQNNVILGGAGRDSLSGGLGNDTLVGGDGADTLSGGTGNDVLDLGAVASPSSSQPEIAQGGSGDDLILFPASAGSFEGGGGNDTLAGALRLFGGQTFLAGTGTDLLILDASETGLTFNLSFGGGSGTIPTQSLLGVATSSTYSGFSRFDFTASVGNDSLGGGAGPDTLSGGGGNDTLRGGLGNDSLLGGSGNDSLVGSGGSDTLRGDAGDDRIFADIQGDTITAGNDLVDGGAGNDTIDGGPGNDTILGGDGDDAITDKYGANAISGGAGADTITAYGAGSTVDGDGGNDQIEIRFGDFTVSGGAGNDTITVGSGAGGLIRGDQGSDTFVISASGPQLAIHGDEFVFGGGGPTLLFGTIPQDTLRISNFSTGTSDPDSGPYSPPLAVTGSIVRLGQQGSLPNGTFWFGIEAFDITADGGDQRIVTGAFADSLRGGEGNDFLDAGAGRDLIDGGSGNDTLVGSLGDTFEGGSGSDLLVFRAGGLTAGFDLSLGTVSSTLVNLSLASLQSSVSVNQRDGTGSGGTRLRNVERLMMVGGGAGGDSISGAEFDDTINGGGGRDTLDGGAGNDVIDGGADDDLIQGGLGNDTIIDLGGGVAESLGGDTVQGDGGDDHITVSSRATLVLGGDGNDTVIVLDGLAPAPGIARPAISLGAGSDYLQGSDAGELISGGVDPIDAPEPGVDYSAIRPSVLRTADGNDTILARGGNDIVSGGAGNDSLDGGEGADTLSGGSGNDWLAGGAGNDLLRGGSDNDTLHGGEDGDTLEGGTGSDVLRGDAGGDVLRGEDGNDSLEGGDGIDTLSGGLGNDTLAGGNDADSISGEDGNDLILGGGGGDILLGGPGNDAVDGGEGADAINGGEGNDSLAGGSDDDTVHGADGADNIDGGTGHDSLTGGLGNDTLDGGIGNDTLSGDDGADTLFGSIGDDSLSGGAGNDTLLGGVGDDLIEGGDGDDLIEDRNADGAPGQLGDRLFGGAGSDRIDANRHASLIDGGSGNDTIAVAESGTPGTADGAVTIIGGAGADSISGSARSELILGGLQPSGGGEGGAGEGGGGGGGGGGGVAVGGGGIMTAPPSSLTPDLADTIDGGGGNDTIDGGAGNDLLFGSEGDDMLTGGGGNDTLAGGAGSDLLEGGAGDDSLFGGANGEDEGDAIHGGAGNDFIDGSGGVFIIDGGDGNDTITAGAVTSVSSQTATISGGAGSDAITVDGDALIDAGAGNDTVTLGSGEQRLVFRYGDTFSLLPTGSDTVSGFLPGEDRLEFDGAGLSFDNLVLTDTAEGVLVGFAGISGAPQVLLAGVFFNDLGPGTIVFTGAPLPRPDVLFMSNGTVGVIPAATLLANDIGLDKAVTNVFTSTITASNVGGNVQVTSAGASGGVFFYAAANADGARLTTVQVYVVETGDGDDLVTIPWTQSGKAVNGSHLDLRDGNDTGNGAGGADFILGGAGNDLLRGGLGDDTLDGGEGNDTLNAGQGADLLLGGLGNDLLISEAGSATMAGGEGNDRYQVIDTASVSILELDGEGTDTILARDWAVLPDRVENGTLTGSIGGALTGNALANGLTGGTGDDSLAGGEGNDRLDGGSGSDTLLGGAGADTFAFRTTDPGAIDLIEDFSAGEGDRISLIQIDANSTQLRDQAFTVVASFSGTAGELVILPPAGRVVTHQVMGDVDGDGLADFTILVQSAAPLTGADFLL